MAAWAAVGLWVLVGALLAPLTSAAAQEAPAAPANVAATAGNGQITLSWTPGAANGAAIIRWEYTQSTPATNVWIPIPGSGPGTTGHAVTGLNNGGPNGDGRSGYRFRVRAVSYAGNGAASAESVSVTPSTVPMPPVDLTAKVGNSQVTLSWRAAAANSPATGFSPILSYEYRQRTGDGAYAPWSSIIGAGPDTAGYVVTGLTNGIVYQFQVRAVNANGAGPSAEAAPVTTATGPGSPRSLTAVPGNGRAFLWWTASNDGGSPITGWQFRLAAGSGAFSDGSPAWVAIPGSSAGTTSHTVAGLDNDGQTYRFQVRAVNEVGSGRPATTEAVDPGTVPARPGNVTASFKEGTADTITLAWTRPDDGGSPILGYQYSQREGRGGYSAWQDIPGARPDTVAHDVSGLVTGTGYRFRVRALNAVGGGAASKETTAIYPGSIPDAAKRLEAVNTYDAAEGTRQVVLRWAPGDDGGSPVTRWEYKYATADSQDIAGFYGDMGWVAICDTAVRADPSCGSRTGVSLPRTPAALARLGVAAGADGPELVPVGGETYQIAVRAVNAHGNGLRSGVAATTIPRIVPSTPSAVYFRDAGDESFRVWWPPSIDGGANIDIPGTDTVLRYQLSYRVAGGLWTPWQNESANTATISNAVRGTRYWVRVRAENAIGHSGVAESAAYVHGGPPTPGADVVGTAPALTAEAGANQVALSLARSANAGSIGGITAATWWEYSYKSGTGEYGDWAFNNSGSWFADVVVDSLENGQPHTFRIRGVNGRFAGPSLESKEVVPGPAPQAPVGLRATGGDGRVALTWTSGGSGPPITRWQVCQKNNANPCGDVATGGGWTDIADSGPDTRGHTVENLVNGTAYTFLVRAWNDRGRGARAQASPATPGTAPDAPVRVRAMAGSRQATVVVAAPNGDGGSPVTGYEIRHRGAHGDYSAWETTSRVGTETTTIATVGGLTNGVSHTLEVRAVNAYGPGIATTLAQVLPVGPPPAGKLVAEPGSAQVVLVWASGGDGGSAITGWQYRQKQASGGYGAWISLAGSGAATTSHTVGGLVNGTAYAFQVRAVNAHGAGDAFESHPVTPGLVPPPPASVTAVRGHGQVRLSWSAGASGAPGEADYAAPPTGWQYRYKAGDGDYSDWFDVVGSGADTASTTVGGIIGGVPYAFEVRAVNEVGRGLAGTASIPAGSVPSAPAVSAVGGDGEITVSWIAGGDGGWRVVAWHYRLKVGIGDYGHWMKVPADTMSVALSDLGGATGVLSYTFQVRAVSGAGEGAAGTSNEVAPVATPPGGGTFYSGVVTGPDFCAERSLGGARLFDHDSDGDGVADVCSLPYTRREAIARQNAVEALAVQNADEYAALVMAACAVTDGDDECGEGMLSAPPAVPINDGGPFYSGIITGPSFCANRSLGGPTTYPHDDDKDGVADVCALPYTRREAIARQLAGDVLAATRPVDFARELASACRGLTGADYGDDADDLANDACA